MIGIRIQHNGAMHLLKPLNPIDTRQGTLHRSSVRDNSVWSIPNMITQIKRIIRRLRYTAATPGETRVHALRKRPVGAMEIHQV
jgi:hypothetical protein